MQYKCRKSHKCFCHHSLIKVAVCYRNVGITTITFLPSANESLVMSIPSHSGLFKLIKDEHGMEALKSVRHYVNTASNISHTHQHIAFNQRCRRYQLLPCSLRVKPLVPSPQGHRIAQRAGQQFLTARVQHCYSKLKSLETDLYFQKRQLEFTLSCQKLTALELYKDESQTRTSSQTKERHKRKFDNLLARQSHPQSLVSHWVVNLSSNHLDASHISVLSRGLNFAPAPTRVPTAHFVTSIEATI